MNTCNSISLSKRKSPIQAYLANNGHFVLNITELLRRWVTGSSKIPILTIIAYSADG